MTPPPLDALSKIPAPTPAFTVLVCKGIFFPAKQWNINCLVYDQCSPAIVDSLLKYLIIKIFEKNTERPKWNHNRDIDANCSNHGRCSYTRDF